jgi:hypothetical protein
MKILKENLQYPHTALCVVRHLLVCTDHEIHTCARSYATLGWISWKSMHFSWKDDSPLWIICVSWCQIERAARLMKWFWQDKHDSRELWQAALLEKPWLHLKWLHFRLTIIPLLISPKTLNYIEYIFCWH